ncbi:MAG: ParB N-terminal domain-containing protein, partial [Chloroflexota bacterium]|nr:ParB N-terminal domain-containing protein [Chloroflexota bacterium]
QRTAPALDLAAQVIDTPAARREAATLAGQTDLFTPRPEPTPIRQAAGEALSEYRRVPRELIQTDRSAYQMRKEAFAEESVENIVTTYRTDRAKFDRLFQPIEVRENPNGTYTVLSGHSRKEAADRLGLESVPIRVVRGSDDEITETALLSNSLGTRLRPTAEGANLRRQMDQLGKSFEQAAKDSKIKTSDARRYIDTTYLPNDLQDLVGNGQLPVNLGARLGQAVREAVMSAADAQSFFQQRMLTRNYSKAQLDHILEGVAYRKQNAGVQQAADMFSGLDLGAPQANATFDLLENLGREISTLNKLRSSLKRLAGSEMADPADSRRLQAVQDRIDTLDAQIGRGPARGPAAISEAADAPATYSMVFPGIPQAVGAVRRAVRRAGDLDAQDAARKYLPITEPNPRPTLTPEAQARLDRRFEAHPVYTNGETTQQVWDSLTERARVDLAEHRRLTGLGVTIPPRRGRRAPTLTREQQTLRDIEAAWSEHLPPGQDFATADPVALSGNRLRREVAIDTAGRLDVDPDQRPNVYQLLTRATAQTLIHSPLFSTSYTLMNLLGNSTNLAIRGARTGDTATVRGAFTEIRPALARRGNLLGKGADPVGGLARIEDELGLTVSPRYGSDVKYDVVNTTGAIREFLDRIYIGRIPVGRGKISSVARPWENTARFNQELEGAQRRGAIAQRVTQRLSEALPDFRRVFDTEATRAGADPAAFTPMFDQLPLVFGAQRLYDQTLKTARAAGVSDARARTLAEDVFARWKRITRRELDAAGKDIEQAFGMSRTSNVDAWLANIFPFVSWHSRASFFLGEELLRSPVFLANFLRYREAAEDWEREHPNAPAAIKGLVRLTASPWGMAYYADPRKLVLTSLFHNEQPLFEPEDAPWLLRAANWLRDKAGVSPHPILMTLAGISGALGDVNVSNPLPMPEIRIFGHLIDAARAATGRGPGLPVVQMGLEAAREFVTRHLPGVDTIPAGDPRATQREAIDAQIEARNPGITDEELIDISSNPEHPEYKAAWRDVAFARGFTSVWNAFSPLRVRVRQPVRDERRERIADARTTAAEQDAAATPPPAEPTMPARYEIGPRGYYVQPVGRDPRVRPLGAPDPTQPVTTARDALYDDPTYAADARREDIIRAAGSPEAQRMIVDHAAYHDLGTPRQQEAQALWVRTAFGTDGVFSPVTVQGMAYTPRRLAELTDQERMTIADAVLAEAGMTEDRQALRDARAAFEQERPEYAAYRVWADQVRD